MDRLIKDGKVIKTRKDVVDIYPDHDFELVEEYPAGYTIWNIGSKRFFKGYLALCKMKDDTYIDTKTLKAIKLKNESLAKCVMDNYCKFIRGDKW